MKTIITKIKSCISILLFSMLCLSFSSNAQVISPDLDCFTPEEQAEWFQQSPGKKQCTWLKDWMDKVFDELEDSACSLAEVNRKKIEVEIWLRDHHAGYEAAKTELVDVNNAIANIGIATTPEEKAELRVLLGRRYALQSIINAYDAKTSELGRLQQQMASIVAAMNTLKDCIDHLLDLMEQNDCDLQPGIDISAIRADFLAAKNYVCPSTPKMLTGNAGNSFVSGISIGLPYPNPASSSLTLPIQSDSELNDIVIVVRDVTGRMMSLISYSASGEFEKKLTLDISELPAGHYFCEVILNKAEKRAVKFSVTR